MSMNRRVFQLRTFIQAIFSFFSPRRNLSWAVWSCVLALAGALWSAAPAHAVYPAPWPDSNTGNGQSGWTAYTYKAKAIADPVGNSPDPSTGGTSPQQDTDVVPTNGIPSTWYAYDSANQVLFMRLHLGDSPLTQTPNGGSGDDPWDAVTWTMLIDTDGDGYKEFAVQLNGDTGTNQNQFDDLTIYYDNTNTQSVASATAVFLTKSASFPKTAFPTGDSRNANYFDFQKSRAIAPAATGGGWFLDWQVPLSGFTVGGNQLITPTTKISFAFGTSNSNVNPLQKDFAFEGGFNSGDLIRPVPFGDILSPGGGITQPPSVTSVTATGCPATVSARVRDTLLAPTSTTVSASITSVKFYAKRDSNGDGTPDVGTPEIYIGERTTPTTPFSDYQISWNTTGILNTTYVVYVIATDDQGNETNSLNPVNPTTQPKVVAIYDNSSCGISPNVSGRVYNDVNRNASLDGAETGTGVTGLYVKLLSGTTVVDSAAVDSTTGAYSLAVANGTYTLILDDNNLTTDTTPSKPPNYVGTEAPTQTIASFTVATGTPATNKNFGLYNGSSLSGRVFHDNGAGGGTASDGVQNGTEAGINNVRVNLTDSAGTTNLGTTTTDSSGNYIFYIPASVGAVQLKVTETNLANYISTGGQVGNTGGSYDIGTDTTTFTNVIGTTYNGVNFADRAVPLLVVNKTASPNGVVSANRVLDYTITATNNGAAISSGTTLQDLIPAGTTYVAGSTTLNGTTVADASGVMPYVSARTINSAGSSAGQIAVGQTATVSFQVTVGSATSATITNTANIDVDGAGPTAPQTATANNNVAKITISKTASPSGAPVAGGTLTYTVTLQNVGTGTSSGTTLLDPIPAGTTYVAGSTTINGTSLSDNSGAMPFATATQINSTGLSGGQIAAGASVVLTFQTQINTPAPVSVTNTATVDVDGPGVSPSVSATASNVGTNINGRVYSDANHNAALDNAESGTGVTGLYVKLISGGVVIDSVAVDLTTGSYAFLAPNGTYTLIVDNNNSTSDTTPFLPTGFIGTEAPNQTISGVVITTGSSTSNRNFGLYNGSILNGQVFHDNGAGGGTAGDGVQNGTEAGINNVRVNLTNSAGTTNLGTTTTDSSGNYTFYIPASVGAVQLKVTETNLANYVSTGGQVGNTGGTYDIATDTTTFTNVIGTTYSGVNFGDAAIAALQISKTASPNGVVSAGRVLTYTITATNNGAAISNGTTLQDLIPAGTTYVAGSTTLNGTNVADVSGDMPYVTARTINSAGASAGQIGVGQTATVTFQVTVDSSAGPTISNTANIDVDGAGPRAAQSSTASNNVAKITISKTVNPNSAPIAGSTLTYTVTLQNVGAGISSGTTLVDPIPAGTTYVAASSTINGTSVSDNGGAMPFVTATQINSAGLSGGQIAAGASVVLTFQTQINTPAPATVTNTATVDVDGPGVSPGISATASNSPVQADLSVSITDGQFSTTPGAPISYTVTVSNAGPGTVNSLNLNLVIPNTIQSLTYTPSQGSYNSTTGLWSGIILAPNGSITLIIDGTVSPSANAPITVTATVIAPAGVNDPDPSNNQSSDTDTLGSTLSGYVYNDANSNSSLDGIESGTGLTGLFAKLVPQGATTATQAVAVDPATGAYSFAGVPAGSYSVVLDNNATLSDITPSVPSGYVSTEGAGGQRTGVIVSSANVGFVNLGLYNGSQLSGVVFRDNGSGSGIANDGVRNGTESGIAGVSVSLTDAAGTTTYNADVTDVNGAYTLFIPAAQSGAALKIVETNAVNFLSTGVQIGNTSGTYDRPTDAVSFTPTAGVTYSGINFGDVPLNDFTNDGATTTTPGNAVFYSHVFTAGSAGDVSFTTSSTPIPVGTSFTSVVYHDVNGNGQIDVGEPILQPTDTISVVAGEQVFLIVKENVPSAAPLGAKDVLSVNANFVYTNASPALTSTVTRTDTTTVAVATGMQLQKSVNSPTAAPGQNITYTIVYLNSSDQAITNIVLNDFTPGFTTFVSASASALPSGLTGPTITSPSVGAVGNIRWTFGGTLAPQATGSVTFTVKVNN